LPKTPTTTTQTPPPAQTGTPAAYFNPADGVVGQQYTLFASGFPANTTLAITLTRPDGVVERYSMTTNASGSGSYSFTQTGSRTVLGTYTATVSGGGRSASASTHVSAGGQQQQTPPPPPPTATATTPTTDGQLQCDPPRSQAEFEQCVESGQIGHD
jgi:hypothetical protein